MARQDDPPDYYDVMWPKDGAEGEKALWLKIGVAFPGKDGRIDVRIDLIPVDGRYPERIFLYPKHKRDP